MALTLGPNASQGEIVNNINYLMATLGQGFNSVTVSPATGIIVNPYSQNNLGYSYQYLNIRYSTSSDGTQNFSSVPTNATYYGLRNSSTTTASENPVDYVWYEVAGGFGSDNYLFYSAIGGRQVQWIIAPAVPNDNYQPTYDGVAVNLDIPTLVNTAINSGTATNAQSALTAITVTSSSQPNIRSVGTMVSLTSTGNIRGNIVIANNFTYANGTTIINTYSNANVANYIPVNPYIVSLTGNVANLQTSVANIQGNVTTLQGNVITLEGNVASLSGNVYGNSNVAVYLSNTTANISTTGNVSASYFIGNVAAGNVSVLGNVSIGGLLSSTPFSPLGNSLGNVGEICWDTDYIYVCVATDTWKQVALTAY